MLDLVVSVISDIHVYYIVIYIFLLISMENNRAIYHCFCTLGIIIFEKLLMRSEIGFKFIAPICRFVNKNGESEGLYMNILSCSVFHLNIIKYTIFA